VRGGSANGGQAAGGQEPLQVLWSATEAGSQVVVAQTADGHRLDFVSSTPRAGEPWVCIVSTLVGCPVHCPICDAGGHYEGRLTPRELLAQLDLLVASAFPEGRVTAERWEVHFTRMGDPAFNDGVLDVLGVLPGRYGAVLPVPVLSSVAPGATDAFFEALLPLRRALYPRLVLQLSLHTTDEVARRKVVPVRTWSFAQMAGYGRRFAEEGGGKVVLSFAAARELPLEPQVLRRTFDPRWFTVKLAALNATRAAQAAGLTSLLDAAAPEAARALAARFEAQGYEVRVALGDDDVASASCGLYAGGGREGPPRPRRTRAPLADGRDH